MLCKVEGLSLKQPQPQPQQESIDQGGSQPLEGKVETDTAMSEQAGALSAEDTAVPNTSAAGPSDATVTQEPELQGDAPMSLIVPMPIPTPAAVPIPLPGHNTTDAASAVWFVLHYFSHSTVCPGIGSWA